MASVASLSCSNTDSVISSSSLFAANPDTASALKTICASVRFLNWTAERLTATRKSGVQLAARLHPRVHLLFEEAIDTTSPTLGPIQGEVGMLQQIVGIGAVVGRDGDADARAHHDLMTVEIEGPVDHLLNAGGQHRGVV